MNYKERYEQALERAKECLKDDSIIAKAYVESIFPELKESEDERIRKDIIRVFKGGISFTSEKENEKYIAWLEKQGKMLDADKVIAWLVANICDYDYYVKLFKKDFEL